MPVQSSAPISKENVTAEKQVAKLEAAAEEESSDSSASASSSSSASSDESSSSEDETNDNPKNPSILQETPVKIGTPIPMKRSFSSLSELASNTRFDKKRTPADGTVSLPTSQKKKVESSSEDSESSTSDSDFSASQKGAPKRRRKSILSSLAKDGMYIL